MMLPVSVLSQRHFPLTTFPWITHVTSSHTPSLPTHYFPLDHTRHQLTYTVTSHSLHSSGSHTSPAHIHRHFPLTTFLWITHVTSSHTTSLPTHYFPLDHTRHQLTYIVTSHSLHSPGSHTSPAHIHRRFPLTTFLWITHVTSSHTPSLPTHYIPLDHTLHQLTYTVTSHSLLSPGSHTSPAHIHRHFPLTTFPWITHFTSSHTPSLPTHYFPLDHTLHQLTYTVTSHSLLSSGSHTSPAHIHRHFPLTTFPWITHFTSSHPPSLPTHYFPLDHTLHQLTYTVTSHSLLSSGSHTSPAHIHRHFPLTTFPWITHFTSSHTPSLPTHYFPLDHTLHQLTYTVTSHSLLSSGSHTSPAHIHRHFPLTTFPWITHFTSSHPPSLPTHYFPLDHTLHQLTYTVASHSLLSPGSHTSPAHIHRHFPLTTFPWITHFTSSHPPSLIV